MSVFASELGSRRRGAPRPVLFAIAAAWTLALVAELTGRASALHLHSTIEGGPPLWAALLLFLVGWQAMLAGMMLPSSLPLIRLFDVVSRRRDGRTVARAAFLGGYAAVWTIFGALAFVGDVGLHRALDGIPWVAERPWLLAGTVLAVAGAFQFSELKERCLAKCRHPAPYLLAHYRRGIRGGFELGLGHGLFCLGCCWALMLVMFGLGVAVLWWMAALTALMVYEKVGRHGAAAAPVAGAGLLVAAALQFAHPGWLPASLGGSERFNGDVTIGPDHARAVVATGGYRLEIALQPNRGGVSNELVLRASRHGNALRGAQLAASFEMPAMEMGMRRYALHERMPGLYRLTASPFAMPGSWRVRIDVAPRRGAPFTARLVDRVAP